MRRGLPSMPKARGERGEQLLLAGAVGELAAQRLARVLLRPDRRVRASRRAAARRLRRDGRRVRRERLFEQGAIVDLVREQDEPRAPACRRRIARGTRRALRRARGSCRRAENRRGCPSSDRCGRRRLRCRRRPASSAMAKTSASSTLRGLTPCAPWIAESAAIRSRSRAARSNSSASAAARMSLGEKIAHGAALAGQKVARFAHQLGIIVDARFRRCRAPSSA